MNLELSKENLTSVLFPLLAVVVGVGTAYFYVLPTFRSLYQLREERGELREEYAELKEKGDRLAALEASNLSSYLTTFKVALPDEEKVPELMSQVQAIAKEAGVEVSALQFAGREEKGTPKVRLQAEVGGDYKSLLSFVEKVEKASRVLKVENLGFTKKEEEGKGEGGGLSASLGLSSYFLEPPREQKVEAPLEFDLSSSSFQKVLGKVQELKVYEVEPAKGPVGKENPFE